MQTKGGGKHDILHVGRTTATTLECMWMMPRDPDADMCPGANAMPVSTEECMAHQSYVPCPARSTSFMARQQCNDRPIRSAR